MSKSIPDFNQCRFDLSISQMAQAPLDEGAEVAFAGRSNAGKSSAVNAITRQKKLARTSKTPGRTQLINFFSWFDDKRLVDLPGFGYAKVAAKVQRQWHVLMEDYFSQRMSLRGLILVMDIRHPLRDLDWQMLAWCQANGIPCHILLNKSDKLSKNQANSTLFQVRRSLEDEQMTATVQLFSAMKHTGLDEVRTLLQSWLLEGQAS